MSLGISFNFLDKDGNLVTYEPRIGGTSVGSDLGNLKFLDRTLRDYLSRKSVHQDRSKWKYAVPLAVSDYMFDLETGELLKNNFK